MNTTIDLPRIPLSKLHLSPLNARKTRNGDVDDLAASIAAHGLLQNLTVTINDKPGEFEVVAGGRRLAAMLQLWHEGRLPVDLANVGVPCLVIENNDVAHEASTAENTLREPMHPADEFDAFSRMVEAGKPIPDIAAHFGVSETVVKQRLKLARVAPDLFQLYRDGKMELSKLQALTVSDDHEAQRKAWNEHGWSANTIREHLVGDKSVRASAPIAKFVGLDAYEAAGGVVKRDLFGSEAWCEDPALLDALALDKLEARAQQLREAGWSWVESRLSLEHAERAEYPALKPEGVEEYLAPERQARLDAVIKRIEEIEAIDSDDVSEEEDDKLVSERSDLEDEADAISAEIEERWPAEAMAKAGCLVTFTLDGHLAVYYGRLRPGEKVGKGNVVTGTPKPTVAEKAAAPKKPELSADMKRCLELHRSAALRVALLDQPGLALRLLVSTLVAGVMNSYGEGYFDICVENVHDRHDNEKYPGLRKSEARVALDDAWTSLRVPKKPSEIDAWVAKLDAKQLQQVIATCMAIALKDQYTNEFTVIEKLLPIDMQAWWQADADRYLAHVNKALILEAVTEACGKDAAAKLATLKRDALIAEAGKLLAGTGWLPKPLRGPGYKLKTATPAKPAAAPKPAKKPAAKAKPAAKPKAKKAAKKPAAKKAKAGKS